MKTKTTTILCMLAMLSMPPVATAQTEGATTARDTDNEALARSENRTPSQTGEWTPDELSRQAPSQTGESTLDELSPRTPQKTGEWTPDELSRQAPPKTREWALDERHPRRPTRTETNHSLAFNIFGLHYAWELPVDRVATVIVRPGVQAGTAWLDGFGIGDDLYYALLPVVDVEPRLYYNLDRRAARGKRTSANQGNFVSLQIKTVLPLGIVSDIHRPRIVGQTILSPMWGMRRVWGRGWLFELSGGMSLNVPWNGDGTLVTPNAGVRFGYSF
jgi:hypothetical protein